MAQPASALSQSIDQPTTAMQELDESCLRCHSAELYKRKRPGEAMPPFIDTGLIRESVHGQVGVACRSCHGQAVQVPHPPNMRPADCQECHRTVANEYLDSIHGQARANRIREAATCVDCHGWHDIYAQEDPRSHTNALNVENTCLRCHTRDEMAERFGFTREHIKEAYDISIHGQQIAAGHENAATCDDCHGSHRILPSKNPQSKVSRQNIPQTCGRCHFTILSEYNSSIHGKNFAAGSTEAPVCNSCHRDHDVLPISSDLFKLSVIEECGHCHQDLLKSYRMSYHGKVTQLGGTTTARCSDCHGHHDILAVNNPESRVSEANIVETCAQCHSGSNENFTKYAPHADYLDRENFPIVFYSWAIMTTLLVSTLIFFTIHTILWFLRLFIPRITGRNKVEHGHASNPGSRRYVQRFSLYNRLTHAVVAVSFLGLTVTGLPLKYSYMDWAHRIFDVLGGFEVAGFLHRMFAVMTLLYVIMHVIHLLNLYAKRRREGRGAPGVREMFGPYSMLPNWQDVKQFFGHVRWFLFRGPRPKFDRWTYYEKFDYWGEMWGVIIIGSTGFMLWFPLLVARLLPGWIFNVATVIHSIEALLAAAVIFTVHFFNAHFRPDKFPMDNVIFTGTMSEEEFKEERPLEYERLKNRGGLEEMVADPPTRKQLLWARILGLSALGLGVGLILCVIYAEIHQHFFLD